MKKIIALVLSLVMISSFMLPVSLAVAAENATKTPIIYIVGKQNTPVYKLDENGNWLLDSNGKKIAVDNVNQPMGMTREEYIMQNMKPVLSELAIALITKDYTNYIQSLVDAVAPIYEDLVLDENGEDLDAKIDWNYAVQNPVKGAGGFNYYYFKYDWRFSPYDTADELHQFVEYVCKKEGTEKVNIHARCYGSNVAMAYLAKSEAGLYDAPFRLNDLILNTTPLAGYIAIGALMSNSVNFDAESIDRFVTYFLNGHDLFEDPMMEMLAMTIVSAANQAEILGLGTDAMNDFWKEVGPELVSKVALSCYGTFPSYWSMIGDKYYDKAKLAVFGTTEAEGDWANFITKLDNYHNLVGDTDEATGKPLFELLFERCQEKFGMDVAVFAKYGYATVPLFDDSQITGDARGTVTELSLGGMGTLIGETFTEKELEEIKALEDYDERYLSKDNKIYAGTCLFPETTWFSKNLHHADLTQIDPIATEFFLSDGKLTVHSDERYPQFHEYDNGKFVEVGEYDETNDDWSDNPYVVLIRVLTAIFKVLNALLKGEVDLPSLGADTVA